VLSSFGGREYRTDTSKTLPALEMELAPWKSIERKFERNHEDMGARELGCADLLIFTALSQLTQHKSLSHIQACQEASQPSLLRSLMH
jgi:hypothetical protein